MASSLCLSPLLSATQIKEADPMTKDSCLNESLRCCKTLNQLKQLHCQITKNGLDQIPSTLTKLVNAGAEIASPESLDYARKAFELFKEDVRSDDALFMLNSLIRGYSSAGLGREAILLYVRMLVLGVTPNHYTFPFVLSGCTKIAAFCEGIQVHGSVVKMGLEEDVFIQNCLIHFYAECGHMDHGHKVFEGMSERNVVSWTSLICGYARGDRPKEAVSLFFEMLNKVMVNALVDMYMKCGAIDAAKRLFDECVDRNLVLYNTILSNYARQGLAREALAILDEMLQQGPRPDRVTMLSAISASAQLVDLFYGKVCHGYWVHTYIEKNGIPCDMRLNTALVDMFARCGDPQSAMQVFNKMTERDVSAWTAAIGTMAMEGNGEGATGLFNQMLIQGVKPDVVLFVQVLTACSHGGQVEQGLHIFSLMEDHGISPQIEHYGCMVDLLGRAGLLREAFDLIKSMPMEPNDVVWGSLLAACRVHKNVEMATYAAERINELAPQRAGVHVLLSNIYASAGKWTDVARVRLNLREKGVRKVPGSSSVQVNGVIHEFTSGDESHPEMTHIALMLQEMNCRFSDAGHIPDLSNVLLDVDEQEKEYLLSRHSEKLAIAFGLIATGRSMPIRVVKNLRMCSDCHSFAKMASIIYNREIIVRDNNRFHFFRQGLCSCCDYW
ncbi:unnamed protein product, partial [Vitis vinifera]